MDWKKIALIGAGLGGLALLARAVKPVQPPTGPPRELAPISNPSFEDGLNGWEQLRYAPHPTVVGNSPDHLVETSSVHVTNGVKSLHLVARKTTGLRNVQAQCFQTVDLSDVIAQGYSKLLVDLHASLNFDAVRAPWGGIYAYAMCQLGGERWFKFSKGVYDETVVFDLSKVEFPAKLLFAVAVWDHEPVGSVAELWADYIGVRK